MRKVNSSMVLVTVSRRIISSSMISLFHILMESFNHSIQSNKPRFWILDGNRYCATMLSSISQKIQCVCQTTDNRFKTNSYHLCPILYIQTKILRREEVISMKNEKNKMIVSTSQIKRYFNIMYRMERLYYAAANLNLA